MTQTKKHLSNPNSARRGFTFVEILLVLTIITMLATMAAPAFSAFQKSTRVQQTARTVLSALNQARAESQRYRTLVATFFGDDTTSLSVKPKNGVLPAYGQIEVAAINQGYNDGCGWISYRPFAPEYGYYNTPNWYPCVSKKKTLSMEFPTFPSGVRVIACDFKRSNGQNILAFPRYKKSGTWEPAVGELKRHCCAYDKRGAAAGEASQCNYQYVIVFDVTTGEHVVIQIGVFQNNARPRILPFQLTHIQLPGQAPKVLDLKTLNDQINNYPDAEAWTD